MVPEGIIDHLLRLLRFVYDNFSFVVFGWRLEGFSGEHPFQPCRVVQSESSKKLVDPLLLDSILFDKKQA